MADPQHWLATGLVADAWTIAKPLRYIFLRDGVACCLHQSRGLIVDFDQRACRKFRKLEISSGATDE